MAQEFMMLLHLEEAGAAEHRAPMTYSSCAREFSRSQLVMRLGRKLHRLEFSPTQPIKVAEEPCVVPPLFWHKRALWIETKQSSFCFYQ